MSTRIRDKRITQTTRGAEGTHFFVFSKEKERNGNRKDGRVQLERQVGEPVRRTRFTTSKYARNVSGWKLYPWHGKIQACPKVEDATVLCTDQVSRGSRAVMSSTHCFTELPYHLSASPRKSWLYVKIFNWAKRTPSMHRGSVSHLNLHQLYKLVQPESGSVGCVPHSL